MDLNAFVWGLVGGFILLMLITLNILFYCMRRFKEKQNLTYLANSISNTNPKDPSTLPQTTNDFTKLKELNEFPLGKLRNDLDSGNSVYLIKKFDPNYAKNLQIQDRNESSISMDIYKT